MIRAYPAHDGAGHEVLTEMSWREDGRPVIRVHFDARRHRFPVLLRFDMLTPS